MILLTFPRKCDKVIDKAIWAAMPGKEHVIMTQKMTWFRRVLTLGLTASLICICFGCGAQSGTNTSDKQGEDIAMEDLEYGATMRRDTNYAVPVEYDKRFLEDGELKALADYYAAIQNEDVPLFSHCVLDFYMESLYQNAYGGLLDDSAYLTQQHEKFQEQIDGDFTFAEISVNDCKEQTDAGSGIEYLIEMFNELNDDDTYCDTHMQSCKALTIQPMLSNSEDVTVACDEVPVFLVNLDGTYYVCA